MSLIIIISSIALVIGIVIGFLMKLTEENYVKTILIITGLAFALRTILPFITNALSLEKYASYISITGFSPIFMLIGGSIFIIAIRGFKFL